MQLLGFVRRKPIWYLIRVTERPRKERAEEKAAAYLRDAGLNVYLPMLDDAPLFGGYLFAELLDREIIERSRCMSLPTFNEVPDWLIEEMQGTDWQRSEDCAPGSKVWIKEGTWRFREAIVKAKKADRIIVVLKVLQQDTELELPLREVEAA